MFDIKIGTMLQVNHAIAIMPQLNPYGFECYELHYENWSSEGVDFKEHAKAVLEAADGRPISTLGRYGNTITQEYVRRDLEALIDNAHLYGAKVIGVFAGGDPTKSVPENIPEFKRIFTELTARAEANGVKLAIENCGEGWRRGSHNIGFCPDAWELMFDAVPSDALGLEWEPAHQLHQLRDPIAQLRKWAKKVVHVHGKDATIGWDVIREHGIGGSMPYVWSRTPGFGDTNWSDIFTILIQNGFEGYCDIEGYHDTIHYDDMEWTSQLTSLEYLKRCRGGLNYFAGPEEYRGYQGKRKK